jgi:hypothetical protein
MQVTRVSYVLIRIEVNSGDFLLQRFRLHMLRNCINRDVLMNYQHQGTSTPSVSCNCRIRLVIYSYPVSVYNRTC